VDWEKKLISRVARDGTIAELIGLGIEDSHFNRNPEGKPGQAAEVFATMVGHLGDYNGAPSFEVVQEKHPGYDFEDPKDNLRYIVDMFLRGVKYRETVRVLSGIAANLDGPGSDKYLDAIDAHLLAATQELSNSIPKMHVERFSNMQTRIAEYEAVKTFGLDKPGIQYPFPEANALTQGIMEHEFVTIAGWSGLGKSFLGLLICFHAYLQGKTPMIVSLEMGADALNRRLDVMATNISANALKAIELEEGDLEKWKQIAEKVEAGRKSHDIIILDQLSRCNASTVYAETIKYNPDLVLVDYISLMDPESGFKGQNWEKVTDLTRRLKSQARALGIPVIGIAQTNIASAKEGAQGDNVAYSRSIFQDSDVMWGLHADDEMKANKRMQLRLLKNREGQTAEIELYWNPDTGIFRKFNPMKDFLTSNVAPVPVP